jgi:flagellar basal body-associated protein FliL
MMMIMIIIILNIYIVSFLFLLVARYFVYFQGQEYAQPEKETSATSLDSDLETSEQKG